ncbi:hypothetical protein NL676_034028 [Syzygium grande]|nr:hypothetical protein NL676_034028 [Syzygium grande]
MCRARSTQASISAQARCQPQQTSHVIRDSGSAQASISARAPRQSQQTASSELAWVQFGRARGPRLALDSSLNRGSGSSPTSTDLLCRPRSVGSSSAKPVIRDSCSTQTLDLGSGSGSSPTPTDLVCRPRSLGSSSAEPVIRDSCSTQTLDVGSGSGSLPPPSRLDRRWR